MLTTLLNSTKESARALIGCLPFAIFMTASLVNATESQINFYVVQHGDTLSTIAEDHLAGHVYGPDGTLEKLIALNPQLAGHRGLIFPGDRLKLISGTQVLTQAHVSIARDVASETTVSVSPAAYQQRSLLRLGARFSYNEVSATDRSTGGHSSIGSDLSPGVELGWHLLLAPNQQVEISAKIDRVDEKTGERTVDNSSFTKGHFGLDFTQTLSSNLSFSAGAAVTNSPFVRAISPTEITITPVMIPDVHLGLETTLIRSSLFGLSGRVDGAWRSSATKETTKVQSGYDYGVSLALAQLRGQTPLMSRLFYQHISQSTSFAKQSESVVGLTFGVDFDFTPQVQK